MMNNPSADALDVYVFDLAVGIRISKKKKLFASNLIKYFVLKKERYLWFLNWVYSDFFSYFLFVEQ